MSAAGRKILLLKEEPLRFHHGRDASPAGLHFDQFVGRGILIGGICI